MLCVKHLVRAGKSRARQTLMVGEGREGGRDQLAECLVNHIMEHEFTLELSILILCWVMETDESCLYSSSESTHIHSKFCIKIQGGITDISGRSNQGDL